MAPLETIEMSTPRITALEGGGPDDNAGSSPLAAARKEKQRKQHKIVVETLAWRDLSYYYKTKAKGGKGSEERAAVKQCTGLVRRGEMVAVMGESVESEVLCFGCCWPRPFACSFLPASCMLFRLVPVQPFTLKAPYP